MLLTNQVRNYKVRTLPDNLNKMMEMKGMSNNCLKNKDLLPFICLAKRIRVILKWKDLL